MKKDWQTHHLMLKRSIGNFWLGIGVRLWRRRSAKKNKECRGKQTMMHTIGTKSFARVSAEIEEDEGIQLSRADLFISTHVNKDGKATDAAASEMIEEARAARVELQETISKIQADYDNKLENLQQQGSDSLNVPPRVSPNSFSSRDANSIKGNSN